MKRMKRIVLTVTLGMCTVISGCSRGVSAEKQVLLSGSTDSASTAAPVAGASPVPGAGSGNSSVKKKTAILVDKKSNKLYLTEYRDGAYQVIKEYHATLGQVKGDKEEEGDLKTPEGIYTFSQHLTPPALKAKFGEMAFYINYPNSYDDLAGRKGFDIMLHATNDPARLVESYDSLGCVVVKNEEIREIKPAIRLGLTPILIFSELTDEFWRPGQNPALKTFFESWVNSWENESIDKYIEHYHSDFSAQGKDKAQWKAFKTALAQRYSEIHVNPSDVMYYRHPKYSVITFTQSYQSKLRGGSWGHRSRGTKILYVAEEAGKPKIIAETFSERMW